MRPLTDIRRARLLKLVMEEGGQAAFSRRVDKDRRQVSAWLADPGKKGHKNISTTVARDIERLCLKPSGWLDHEESEAAVNPAARLGRGSHPARTDRAKMRDAVLLLKELAKLQAAPIELASDPDAICIAYDFLLEFDTSIGESNVLDMTQRLAAKIRGDTNGDEGTERSKVG